MRVTSTEFQQNVGFYLREAENGKAIEISKSKPTKAIFNLSLAKQKNKPAKMSERNAKILKMIKDLDIHDTESGLDFQHRVRG